MIFLTLPPFQDNFFDRLLLELKGVENFALNFQLVCLKSIVPENLAYAFYFQLPEQL